MLRRKNISENTFYLRKLKEIILDLNDNSEKSEIYFSMEDKNFSNLCTKCGRILSKDEFYFSKEGKRTGYCKECQKKYSLQKWDKFRKHKKEH